MSIVGFRVVELDVGVVGKALTDADTPTYGPTYSLHLAKSLADDDDNNNNTTTVRLQQVLGGQQTSVVGYTRV
jgi:hypothetical protein